MLVLFFSLALLYSASKKVTLYDTDLYHFNSVKWVSDYPAVPGLTNLHLRLGYNSSLFVFGAFVNNFFLRDSSSHVTLSLLLFVLLVRWLYSIFLKDESLLEKIFYIFTFPYIIMLIWSQEVASFSTDLFTGILLLVFSFYALQKDNLLKSIILVPLSFLLITGKLSGAVAVPVAIYIFIKGIYGLQDSANFRKLRKLLISFSSALSLLVIVGFILRNIVLSGWLLFPFPIGNLHLPWSVPVATVNNELLVLKAWGRSPGPGYIWSVNTDFWGWFTPWFASIQDSEGFKLFGIGVVTLLLGIIFGNYSKIDLRQWPFLNAVLLLCILGIGVVIYSSPQIRFAVIFFWIFFAAASAMSVSFYLRNSKWLNLLILIVLFITMKTYGIWPNFNTRPLWLEIVKDTTLPVKQVVVSPKGIKPELSVWFPIQLDLCGNSALPCAPNPPTLKERVSGDISKGFLPIN